MNILITNDDGIDGVGLQTLASVLRERGHKLSIVAPRENNSAVSHKLTMRSAVPLQKISEDEYAVGGTPADCVLIAISYLKIKPDLLLSGINTGVNLGSDVIYSGTVAGALEGAQQHIPSIALSQYLHDFKTEDSLFKALKRAAEMTAAHLSEWLALAKETGALNINFPCVEPLGVRFCRQAYTNYSSMYRLEEDGLHLVNSPESSEEESDFRVLKAGFLTITPLKNDHTDYTALQKWGKLS